MISKNVIRTATVLVAIPVVAASVIAARVILGGAECQISGELHLKRKTN